MSLNVCKTTEYPFLLIKSIFIVFFISLTYKVLFISSTYKVLLSKCGLSYEIFFILTTHNYVKTSFHISKLVRPQNKIRMN